MRRKPLAFRPVFGALLALFGALFGGTIGLVALLNPIYGSQLFGMPASTSVNTHWVRIYGIRNLSLALGNLLLLWNREWRALGLMAFPSVLVVLVDAWTVMEVQGGITPEVMGHLAFLPLPLIIGWLLLW